MCGIVGVVRKPGDRVAPDLAALRRDAGRGRDRSSGGWAPSAGRARRVAALESAAAILRDVDRQLREGDGVRRARRRPDRPGRARAPRRPRRGAARRDRSPARRERARRRRHRGVERRARSRARTRSGRSARTASISRSRSRTCSDGTPSGPAALDAFHAVQITLSAIDRLEVRGRDSAGLHVVVTGHGLDLDDPTIARLVERAQSRSVVHRGLGAHARRASRVRLQDRGRDR